MGSTISPACGGSRVVDGMLRITVAEVIPDEARIGAAIWAILGPLHPQPGVRDVHFVAPQADCLGDPQAVAIHHEHKQVIAHAMPAAFAASSNAATSVSDGKSSVRSCPSTAEPHFNTSPFGHLPLHPVNSSMSLSLRQTALDGMHVLSAVYAAAFISKSI
jgi:hypothetical protein